MRRLHSVPYSLLYIAWGILFILTVVLGFSYPEASGGEKAVLVLISVLFFLPPWGILLKAKAEHNRRNRSVIRWLALASLAGTLILLILNLRSVGWSEAVGLGLHAALTVVSAPMICSNMYVLPLFLWACLLMGSFSKDK